MQKSTEALSPCHTFIQLYQIVCHRLQFNYGQKQSVSKSVNLIGLQKSNRAWKKIGFSIATKE